MLTIYDFALKSGVFRYLVSEFSSKIKTELNGFSRKGRVMEDKDKKQASQAIDDIRWEWGKVAVGVCGAVLGVSTLGLNAVVILAGIIPTAVLMPSIISSFVGTASGIVGCIEKINRTHAKIKSQDPCP